MDVIIPHILIIDDEPIVLDILRHIIEQENYKSLSAYSGKEGLRLAREEKPDLILLDINLDDISGFEVCRQLKSDTSTEDIPVIFLTGIPGGENEQRGFNEGAFDFLAKPIKKAQLSSRMNNALEVKYSRDQLKQQTLEFKTVNAALKGIIQMKEQAVTMLKERDGILSSINYVANAFLKNENWKEVLPDVLEQLGTNVPCEHVYFMTLESLLTHQEHYSWFKKDHTIDCSSMELLMEWQQPTELLISGKPITGPNVTLPASVLESFLEHNIGTYLILPVYVYQTLWGCLGFDCTRSDREWGEPLINAMNTASDIIGSAMQRTYESRERQILATAINQFTDCIYMTDDDGWIFYVNPACIKNTGFRPDELVGRKFQNIQSDAQERVNCDQILDIVGRSGKDWRGHMRNKHKDGSLYDEAVNIVPIRDEQDRVTSFVIIKRDETEKNRLESIAEAANLMDNVGFVFSGIRHELGNPLNSLKMAVSVLRRQIDKFSQEKIMEFLDRSMNEIKRMEYLLYSLKNFNVFEEQKLAQVDLVVFLENFKRLHEEDLRKKGIRMQSAIVVEGCGLIDERAMHQVLLNLITNSVNALEGREEPAITLCLEKKQKDFMELRFEDNGCGFPESRANELFQPFFTTYAKGTGLGLTIVQKMLISMNCTISIEGKEGVGTSIIITIPECERDG